MKKALALAMLIAASSAVPAMAASQSFPIPKDSQLVGTASVNEMREFPEQSHAKGSTHAVEETQKLSGVDKLYETKTSYADSVKYLDKTLQDDHFTVNSRTTTKTSTVWALTESDGDPARLAVRNTSPTTVEWITAKGSQSTTR